ncbi:MAG: dihydrolipoamide acetyltransferase family protein [Bacteroidales bacterium]
MASFKLVMPKLGESIIEATITRWIKAEGDPLEEDDAIVEIATDKVDSEIPSPVAGKLVKRYYNEGDVVPVGEVIALIAMEGEEGAEPEETKSVIPETNPQNEAVNIIQNQQDNINRSQDFSYSVRFYSPLVKNIAKQENIAVSVLDTIPGTGKENRLTKQDLMNYLAMGGKPQAAAAVAPNPPSPAAAVQTPAIQLTTGDEVIEMDRMRKLIADHMVNSVKISPHVTSIIEVDMTNIVSWREKVKDSIQKRHNEKVTFTHIFLDAIAKTIREFPLVNASVDGTKIIIKKSINIGMAVALPSGNLIVPVIKNVDQKSLLGVIKDVNDIADRARNNKLQPDEVQGGTITLTNLGSFGTLMGTPIINQPQVAIVAVGSITKRPVVLETSQGDVIAVRQMMYLSLSYDHRVIDGALGGKFIYRMKEILENFDTNFTI